MTNSLNIALQMDLIDKVDFTADTSFRIAFEGHKRGHKIFYYIPENLSYKDGSVVAKGNYISLTGDMNDPNITHEERKLLDLSTVDVILVRQDPPFDMAYITNTYLLDTLRNDVLIINDPFWIRNLPEKLIINIFPEFIPATLISRDMEQILDFIGQHKEIILKPLYGNGGFGVFKISEHDSNLSSLCEMFFSISKEPIILQKFITNVSQGDKRIILIDGQFAGAINRIPLDGEIRSNMHVGGNAHDTDLTERERQICEKIGPILRDKGLFFVGIDVIDGFLTEINTTSPTGIQEIERFKGINIAEGIWEAIEAKIGTFSSRST